MLYAIRTGGRGARVGATARAHRKRVRGRSQEGGRETVGEDCEEMHSGISGMFHLGLPLYAELELSCARNHARL